LNLLFTDRRSKRGDYPVGVDKTRGKYRSQIMKNSDKNYIGLFDTPEEAHQVYKSTKLEYIRELMEDYPDPRIKQAVLRKADALYSAT
jgi:hypothetical protein